MTAIDSALLTLVLVFMRVGTCMMLFPALGSTNVPIRVRLFAALGISFALFPIIHGAFEITPAKSDITLFQMMFAEFLLGAIIALPVRYFIMAVLFAGEVTTQLVGLNPIPGVNAGDDQVSTILGTFYSTCLVTLLMISGLHLSFFMVILNSYMIFEPGEFLLAGGAVQKLTNHAFNLFLLVIQLSAPILIVAIIMNLIAGLVNKLTPQMPIYFVSAPFLIAVSLGLMSFIIDDFLNLLNVELATLISRLLR